MLKIKLIVVLATIFAVSALLYILYSNKADYKANLKLDKNMKILEFDAVSTTLRSFEDKVMFSQWDTSINVYSLKYNKIIFKKNTEDICYAKPLLENDLLYYPYSNKLFNCVDIITGNVKWQIGIEDRCDRSDLVNDSIMILSIKGHGLKVINRNDGKLIYELKYNFNECLVPDASPWEIAYDDKCFYLSNWQGSHLSCFKISDGSLNWNYKSVKSGMSGQSICFENKIFLEIDYFYKGGKIVILDRTSGKVEFETNSSPLLFQTVPVFYDNEIYCYNYSLNKDKKIIILLKLIQKVLLL